MKAKNSTEEITAKDDTASLPENFDLGPELNIPKAMDNLDRLTAGGKQGETMPFSDYLRVLTAHPYQVIRNVFQIFHDMVTHYVGEGYDEYSGDPESINYVCFDCSRLFIDDTDHPFFADRLFANRLVKLVKTLKRSAQQNKIYIFRGPHGCGKSTFLNNLLKKFEEYANSENGRRFETVWRLDRKHLGAFYPNQTVPILERLLELQQNPNDDQFEFIKTQSALHATDEFVEVACPSHDNPILMVPKSYRRQFFDDLFKNDEFKWKLFTEKEYEWVFTDIPCTICSSIYQALLNKLKSPKTVFDMVYARSYGFNRRMGEGISVYNPGDKPMKQNVLSNAIVQNRINNFLKDSNQVRYLFSQYAKTNNGVYALMDIKSSNTDRLIELHNIISEGVHKVEEIEENVNSLLLAVMNPEDEKNIQEFQSFLDRIEYIKIPYVMDLNTETEIYRNIFGKHINEAFLPRVLHNFARVIISSRLNKKSDALLEWIGDPEKYRLYCDENLLLLKMEIYTGHIPPWLSEEDRKRLTAKRRRDIIAESENEGEHGISGRDSIKIFNQFYSMYAHKDKLINMPTLCTYFTKIRKDLGEMIPSGFLDSLLRMYDYSILQEVKECLYYYNEERISREIQNYLFAINFELGSNVTCTYTGEKLEISESFFEEIENQLVGIKAGRFQRLAFRENTQKEYTSRTLTQEIMVDGMQITDTKIFQELYDRYVYNLKEKVLDPILENENFRRAIKDYDEEDFKAYDQKIQDDVTYLLKNLVEKYQYTEQSAKEICMYVIDSDIAKKFGAASE